MGKVGKEATRLIEGLTNVVLSIAKIIAIVALVLLAGFFVLVIIRELQLRSWRKQAEGLADCQPPDDIDGFEDQQ